MQKTAKCAEARFIESEATCPGLYHFLNYWQAKLLWDADADLSLIHISEPTRPY